MYHGIVVGYLIPFLILFIYSLPTHYRTNKSKSKFLYTKQLCLHQPQKQNLNDNFYFNELFRLFLIIIQSVIPGWYLFFLAKFDVNFYQ